MGTLAAFALAATERKQLLLLPPSGVGAVAAAALAEAAAAEGFCVESASADGGQWLAAVVLAEDDAELGACWELLSDLKRNHRAAFTLLFSRRVAGDPVLRLRAFAAGARMVSDHLPHAREALRRVAAQGVAGGSLSCPSCGLRGLTENELHAHHNLYHTVEPNDCPPCPLCGAEGNNFALHFHNSHGPAEAREPPVAPYSAFAWVVCRARDGRFFLVNEPAGIARGAPRYWLPAGRVDAGESLLEAARRETMEEGGLEVRITGVLRFMVSNLQGPRPCPRVVFLAEPAAEGAPPKSIPDWESAGALWVAVESLHGLGAGDYRSSDPTELFPAVATGALCPLSLETDAFRRFDELLVRLTRGEREGDRFQGAWAALRTAYPPGAFREH